MVELLSMKVYPFFNYLRMINKLRENQTFALYEFQVDFTYNSKGA